MKPKNKNPQQDTGKRVESTLAPVHGKGQHGDGGMIGEDAHAGGHAEPGDHAERAGRGHDHAGY